MRPSPPEATVLNVDKRLPPSLTPLYF